jgi:hypothetical protein
MSYISGRLQLNNSRTLRCRVLKLVCAENGTHRNGTAGVIRAALFRGSPRAVFLARTASSKMGKGLPRSNESPRGAAGRDGGARSFAASVIDTPRERARCSAGQPSRLGRCQFRARRVAQPVRRQGRHEK